MADYPGSAQAPHAAFHAAMSLYNAGDYAAFQKETEAYRIEYPLAYDGKSPFMRLFLDFPAAVRSKFHEIARLLFQRARIVAAITPALQDLLYPIRSFLEDLSTNLLSRLIWGLS